MGLPNKKAARKPLLSPQTPALRRAADLRRPLCDDEARPLQMLHEMLGDDLGHDLVGVADPLAALEPQRVGERRGKVGRVGGGELVGVGHGGGIEQTKDKSESRES